MLFIAGTIVLFAAAPWVVLLLTGKHDPLATTYVRAISLVPFFAALNAMNVIDLLVKGKYNYLFHIGLILCSIAVLVSLLFVYFGDNRQYGYYPLIIEACSLPLYIGFIRNLKQSCHLTQ